MPASRKRTDGGLPFAYPSDNGPCTGGLTTKKDAEASFFMKARMLLACLVAATEGRDTVLGSLRLHQAPAELGVTADGAQVQCRLGQRSADL